MNIKHLVEKFLHKLAICACVMGLYSCARTINTVSKPEQIPPVYAKALVVSADDSQYIKFKLGVIIPFAYFVLPDEPAQKHEVIGNTDLVIKRELEKNGIQAEIGKKDTTPDGFDLIVLYNDVWRWDFKKVLDKLEIVFVSPDSKEVLARSTYNIYRNKEFHNFPTPEKEVPKMVKALLQK